MSVKPPSEKQRAKLSAKKRQGRVAGSIPAPASSVTVPRAYQKRGPGTLPGEGKIYGPGETRARRTKLGEIYHGECEGCCQPMWSREPAHFDRTFCAECQGSHATGEHPESVDRYFEQISKYKLFTPEEELACARAVRKGDAEARGAFICANLRLVVKIAHEFRADFLPLEDRISEGNLGLFEAVDRFDPEKLLRFSTYAAFWIKHKICLALCKNARAYRLPPGVYGKLTKYRKALETFFADNMRDPSDEELAAKLSCPLDHVDRYRKLHESHEISLNESHDDRQATTNGMEDGMTSPDLEIEDPRAIDPARAAATSNLRDELDSAMLILDARERKILTARFPLDGSRPAKVGELAAREGMSLESIRLIQNRAMEKVRNYLIQDRGVTLMADLLPPPE